MTAAQGKAMNSACGANRTGMDSHGCSHHTEQPSGRMKPEGACVHPLRGGGYHLREDGQLCFQNVGVGRGQRNGRILALGSCSFEKEGPQLSPGGKAKDRAGVPHKSAYLQLEGARSFPKQDGRRAFARLQRPSGLLPILGGERTKCPVASFESRRPFVGGDHQDLLGALGRQERDGHLQGRLSGEFAGARGQCGPARTKCDGNLPRRRVVDGLLESDGAAEFGSARGHAFEEIPGRGQPPISGSKYQCEALQVRDRRQGLLRRCQRHVLEPGQSLGTGLLELRKISDTECITDARRNQPQPEKRDSHCVARLKTKEALFPPKPKEFEIATLSGAATPPGGTWRT